MAYLDAAADRAAETWRDSVEAIRAGYIFARDPRSYRRWKMDKRGGGAVGLTGAALEQAVMSLARTNPEYVVVGA